MTITEARRETKYTHTPRIALVSHDTTREALIELLREFLPELHECSIVATQATGTMCKQLLGLPIEILTSSVKGGDILLGALVVEGKVDAVIFIKDPFVPMAWDPTPLTIMRACDMYDVPIATNIATARAILSEIRMGLKAERASGAKDGAAQSAVSVMETVA
ncbi:MAG: methylglyoxal synthase [Dehalococcoidia bacterium]|nr:methylglyoxal synthase [Dehalococcoidia bacterium]